MNQYHGVAIIVLAGLFGVGIIGLVGWIARMRRRHLRAGRAFLIRPWVVCGHSHPDPNVERHVEAFRAAEGHAIGPFGGCGYTGAWWLMYRCVECGRWFHRACIARHFAASHDPAGPLKTGP